MCWAGHRVTASCWSWRQPQASARISSFNFLTETQARRPSSSPARARELTRKLGDQLAGQGYLGFFEVDYLVDTGSGELYLSELNPRISGISPMTNVTAGAYAGMPLFLFHLLEYLDLDYEVDIDEINQRWSREAAVDVWSQLILKETSSGVDLLTSAPRSGSIRWRRTGRPISGGRPPTGTGSATSRRHSSFAYSRLVTSGIAALTWAR
jgi:hypothetical protein